MFFPYNKWNHFSCTRFSFQKLDFWSFNSTPKYLLPKDYKVSWKHMHRLFISIFLYKLVIFHFVSLNLPTIIMSRKALLPNFKFPEQLFSTLFPYFSSRIANKPMFVLSPLLTLYMRVELVTSLLQYYDRLGKRSGVTGNAKLFFQQLYESRESYDLKITLYIYSSLLLFKIYFNPYSDYRIFIHLYLKYISNQISITVSINLNWRLTTEIPHTGNVIEKMGKYNWG